MDDNEAYPILMDLAERIAGELSDPLFAWTAEPRYGCSTVLRRHDGLSINLHCGSLYRSDQNLIGKRISLSGHYPNDLFGNRYDDHDLPNITIGATRPPARIAADIRSRLLPSVEDHTQKANAWVEQRRVANETCTAIAQCLAAAGLGEAYISTGSDPQYTAASPWSSNFASWKAKISDYDFRVELELRELTSEQAARLLEVLMQ